MVHLMTAFAADRWDEALLKSICHLFSKAEIYLLSSGWLPNGDAGLCKLELRDS